jgi:hypothetical protein
VSLPRLQIEAGSSDFPLAPAYTALRPIVHAINRQPSDAIEAEQGSIVSIDCRKIAG